MKFHLQDHAARNHVSVCEQLFEMKLHPQDHAARNHVSVCEQLFCKVKC